MYKASVMAPTSKPAAAADGRRKSSGAGKPSLVIKLSVPPSNLRDLMDKSDQGSATPAPQADDDVDVKQRTPDSASTTQPAAHDANNASDSNAATPQADNGTPAPAAMGPPADGPKKKGVKRANGAGGDSTPKARGKPGPKKKPRLCVALLCPPFCYTSTCCGYPS